MTEIRAVQVESDNPSALGWSTSSLTWRRWLRNDCSLPLVVQAAKVFIAGDRNEAEDE